MSSQRCIAYAAGPGDVVSTFKHWLKGEDDPHQVAITYSGQFFDLCQRIGVYGVVLSSNPRKDSIATDQFHVENIPSEDSGRRAQFHYRQMRKSMQFLSYARTLGADTFVISDATGHWFPFSLLKKTHEKLIPTLHCVLWSRFHPLSKVRRVLNVLERSLFRNHSSGILCVSKEIADQAEIIAQSDTIPVRVFNPVYRKDTFREVTAPPRADRKFSIFFAGRLETEKGIYDLVRAAENFKKNNITDICFNILGNGSEELRLRSISQKTGIEDIFKIHGYCEKEKVLEILSDSHVIIVPTSTQFHEGFNKVVAEGILSGRPVITSSACPALNCVRDAVVEVPPDDASAYEQAILKLRNDPVLYQQKRSACKELSARFYDTRYSWGTALESVL